MTPQNNGIYVAQPTSIAIEEKSTGSVQANVQFKLVEYRGVDGKSSEPCDLTFTAFMNLIRKDGKLNEINHRSFCEAFGWDGSSFSALANIDITDLKCQVVVGDEKDQNGSTVKRIKYINPIDYTPGASVTSDPNVVQSLDAKYGAMLRATASTSGRTAAKPANKAVTPSKTDDVSTAKQVAYAKFISMVDDYGRTHPDKVFSTSERNETFKHIAGVFGKDIGKDPKAFTPEDFAKFTAEIEKKFSAEHKDLLPF